MFIALKVFIVAVKLAALGLLVFVGYLVYEFKILGASEVDLGLVAIVRYEDSYRMTLRKEDQGIIKAIANVVNDFLYQEATEHNPEGDIIPDGIDDTVKNAIKDNVEFGHTEP